MRCLGINAGALVIGLALLGRTGGLSMGRGCNYRDGEGASGDRSFRLVQADEQHRDGEQPERGEADQVPVHHQGG